MSVPRPAVLLAACLIAVQSVAAQNYRVVKEIPIGGPGGWDYIAVDTSHDRLYVSHSTHVVVIDLKKDSVIGDIANTPGVHGTAFAPEFNRGFTTNGADTSVTIFNLTTLAEIARVKVTGRNPDALWYDPVTKRVFTFNHSGGNATAIDAATGTVVGTIPLKGTAVEAGVSDARGHVFVNIEDSNEIIEFDGRSLAVLHTWSIAPCGAPTGLAIDRKTNRLFAGCAENSMIVVVDAATGKVTTTIPAGAGIDAVAFDPATNTVFSSNGGGGSMTVAHQDGADTYTVVATVPTRPRSRTMTIDPKTHKAYMAFAAYQAPPPMDSAAAAAAAAAVAAGGRGRGRGLQMVPNSFGVLVLDIIK